MRTPRAGDRRQLALAADPSPLGSRLRNAQILSIQPGHADLGTPGRQFPHHAHM